MDGGNHPGTGMMLFLGGSSSHSPPDLRNFQHRVAHCQSGSASWQICGRDRANRLHKTCAFPMEQWRLPNLTQFLNSVHETAISTRSERLHIARTRAWVVPAPKGQAF
jgi:hypothetical protein